MDLAQLADDFAFFDSWEEKYRYLIDLGRDLPPMDDADKTEGNRVTGCISKVWVKPRRVDGDPSDWKDTPLHTNAQGPLRQLGVSADASALFLRLDVDGRPPAGTRPSAETALHLGLYRREPDIGAVLHTHSVNATVLSRLFPEGVPFEDHEIAKAFPGVDTHESAHRIPVWPNDQDVDRLWSAIAPHDLPLPGFLIGGHGLYAWGTTVDDALRHVEAFEHLFACIVLEHRLRSVP